MIYIIKGMKNPAKLGTILYTVAERVHELGGPEPAEVLRFAADAYEEQA